MIDGLNLETLAVILGIAYIVLAMRENSLCWYCAFFSTALYVWIFGDVSLYMESALNVYYMGMAVYGWFLWRRGGEQKAGVTIVRWPVSRHLQIVCIILLLSLGSGYLLSEHTNAHRPFVDSFTTWASVLATFETTHASILVGLATIASRKYLNIASRHWTQGKSGLRLR